MIESLGISVGGMLGGLFVRVCRMCRRGALRVMWGAVGFVEVANPGGGVVLPVGVGASPFEDGQGSVLSS